jgi:hypothetical protein
MILRFKCEISQISRYHFHFAVAGDLLSSLLISGVSCYFGFQINSSKTQAMRCLFGLLHTFLKEQPFTYLKHNWGT